jgi:hypothetical protein
VPAQAEIQSLRRRRHFGLGARWQQPVSALTAHDIAVAEFIGNRIGCFGRKGTGALDPLQPLGLSTRRARGA